MEKVRRGGFRDRSPQGRFGRDRDARGSGRNRGGGGGGYSGGGGARGGGSVSQFCVKLRGLPWSATKVIIKSRLSSH